MQNRNNTSWSDELKSKISQLERTNEVKEAEINVLRSEMQDTLSSSIITDELTVIVLKMMMDNNEFIQKHGLKPKAKEAKERLLRLMQGLADLSDISVHRNTLKSINRQLQGNNQLLRVEIANLNKKIAEFTEAFNEA